MSYGERSGYFGFIKASAAVAFGTAVIIGALWAWPTYNVWSSEMAGRAEYARAESSRKIAILEAQAKEEAAKALAKAEVERAKGVAAANQIIGDSLKGNDAYLHYLWLDELKHANVIYVPTESNLPILEAGRQLVRKTPKASEGK